VKILRVIAFDLGANMAWADSAQAVHRNFAGTRVVRLAAIATWLAAFKWSRYDVVVYETPFARGRDATRSSWGIAGILEAAVTNAGLPIVDVAVPTIKKFATGHGFAPKNDMVKAAQRFGYIGDNEHEADAVCLLNYALANLEKIAA
jgi:Holliday junction resolvasome RuvABC endonuclease subunit